MIDKNTVKKFAVWAHEELVRGVKAKAQHLGIIHTSGVIGDIESSSLAKGELLLRDVLIHQIETSGFDQVMELAASTWFNRFCALRFMEVNGYLPGHVRVFTDEYNAFRPQILKDVLLLKDNLEHLDIEKVRAWIKKSDMDALYQYLILMQCRTLNVILPDIFAGENDIFALLLPDHLLCSGSVIDRLIQKIPEDNFNIASGHGEVEIIGWLYQYYMSEKHDKVVDPLYGKYITKEDVPVATQVFTTDWIVKYIVDNTVGRYWMEHHPESSLVRHLEYYIANDGISRSTFHDHLCPQEITVLDPCVGTGHFLVYVIDVLMEIYRECGYSDCDAIAEIIHHNLYGIDIDNSVAGLARFSIMMKACQYDQNFLGRGLYPKIFRCVDSRFIRDELLEAVCMGDAALRRDVQKLADAMSHANEFGSMIQIPKVDIKRIEQRVAELETNGISVSADSIRSMRIFLNIVNVLSLQYAVVATNPPYLNKYDKQIKAYIQNNYKDYSGDLFSVFMYRCIQFCKPQGYVGLMTPNVWMFIRSYEKLRRYILQNHSIITLVQLAKGAFFSEATVDVCAFVIQSHCPGLDGVYFRLEEFGGNMDYQNAKLLHAIENPSCSYRYHASSKRFESLPGMPIGYWVSDAVIHAFQRGESLKQKASPRQGLATTNNRLYLRRWYEVDLSGIGFGLDRQTAIHSDIKWFPYNKGGEFRKWYGNQDYIVNYQYDGRAIKHDVLTKYPYLKNPDFVVKNPETYFRPSLSWSKISSGSVAFRYFPQGFLYDVSGCSIFFEQASDMYYYAAFLNSIVCSKILEILSPTLNYEAGHIGMLPILWAEEHKERIRELVQTNIELCKESWDSFETSWEFKHHPLL